MRITQSNRLEYIVIAFKLSTLKTNHRSNQMNEYYQHLGVETTASADEIKQAYRRLANKYHPDKSTGNTDEFKKISVAYDTLSNPEKRQAYDNEQNGFHHFGGHGFAGGFAGGGNFHFDFGDFFGHQQRRNKDLSIRCVISLYESLIGKDLEVKYKTHSGNEHTVKLTIPAGIASGVTMQLHGYGDDTLADVPRGTLNVKVFVTANDNFTRVDDDIFTTLNISVIDAMIGCTKEVTDLHGNTSAITIKPGVDSGTEYAKQGKGFKNIHNGNTGRFVIVVKVKTPAVTDAALIEQLKALQSKLL